MSTSYMLKYRLATIGPILLGIVAFFVVVGPNVLYPSNIAWLGAGDPATHYLGWHFFRNSEWSFPVGLNPGYGLELGNAILFSDSNPLLAFLFKPFSSVLPVTFQYFGIWLLACFVLQALFAWKLVGLISKSAVIRFLGAGLFVFAPPMIWRMHGHLSLAGHFFVLAGLYLLLRPTVERRAPLWALLLGTAAMVHAYLLAMVSILWLTDLIQVLIRRQLTRPRVAIEFVGIAFVVSVVCWQVGYFVIGTSISVGGYGEYRMNLFSFVDPSGWSYVLRDIPEAIGEYEGFNFLGLGVLMLAIAGFPSLIAGRSGLWSAVRTRGPLLLALGGLFLFAVSHKVGVGLHEFNIVGLGDLLIKVANVFRASGRMAWPLYYVLILALILVVVRGNSSRVAALLLGLAFAVQIADTSANWLSLRNKLMSNPSTVWESPLKDAFWSQAARKYGKVRWIYPGNQTPHWQSLSYYAARFGLTTDAVYLARVDSKNLIAAHEKAAAAIREGRYESDSLYVLDSASARSAFLTLNRNIDLIAKVDGYYVIAPRWIGCGECSRLAKEVKFGDLFTPVKVGERIEFAQSSNGTQYLVSGWSGHEPQGTWSDGNVSVIVLPFVGSLPTRLVIEGNSLVSSSHPQQRVEIFVNDVRATAVSITSISDNHIEVLVPEEARGRITADGLLRLQFAFPDAARPVDLGINDDPRRLALHLMAITLM